MDTYTVEITETLQKQIHIKANSNYDAINAVKKMYKDGEIILTADNFTNIEFEEPVECAIARQIINTK